MNSNYYKYILQKRALYQRLNLTLPETINNKIRFKFLLMQIEVVMQTAVDKQSELHVN